MAQSRDDLLEMLSMMDQQTRIHMRDRLETALSQGRAEIIEHDLSGSAEALIMRHNKIAETWIALLQEAEAEISNLNTKPKG